MEFYLGCVSVLQRDRSSRALIRRSLQCVPVALPRPSKHGFDMFARSQRIDGGVGTGATVLKQTRPAKRDSVDSSTARLDLVVALSVARGPFQDTHYGTARPCLPFGDLLLN